MQLERDVHPADVMRQKLDLMPGFRFTWYYSGMDVKPEPDHKYKYENRAFSRNGSINITIHICPLVN